MTARERGVVAAILGFFLLGLIARHAALKRERPDPVRPGEIGNLEEEP